MSEKTEEKKTSPRIVLITGCSTGVGLELAVLLAKTPELYKVYASMRDLKKAEELNKKVAEAKVGVELVRLDVTDVKSVQAAVDEVTQKEGRIDILINNAGFGHVFTIEQSSHEEIRNVFEGNFFGVVNTTKAVVAGMRERKSGHIINVSSVGGLVGQPFNEIYCAAKFAVEGLTESMATLMVDFGVHCSVVEPAGISTAFSASVMGAVTASGGVKQDAYAQHLGVYFSNRTNPDFVLAKRQTGLEVAEVIARCAADSVNGAKPHLRYVTSDTARNFCAIRLGDDPTGDKIVASTRHGLLHR